MSDQWDAMTPDETRAAATWLDRRCHEVAPAEETAHVLFHWISFQLGVPAHLLDARALVIAAAMPEQIASEFGELVDHVLTIPGEKAGTEGKVGTLFGLAQVAQGGLAAHTERMLAAFDRSGLQPGQVGGWFCPMCQASYPDDYEPDLCPPCGARLMRMRAASDAEREAYQRERRERGGDGA